MRVHPAAGQHKTRSAKAANGVYQQRRPGENAYRINREVEKLAFSHKQKATPEKLGTGTIETKSDQCRSRHCITVAANPVSVRKRN